MNHTAKKTLVGTALAAGLLGLAAPAVADTAGFRDARGDMRHGADLHRVKVVNEKNVRVVMTHENLVRSYRSNAGFTVYLDTDRSERGPEFAFVGGLFEGSDYALVKTDGWKLRDTAVPLTSSYELNLDYADDVARLRMSRASLDRPGDVRVAVRTGGEQRDGDIVRDWLGERRELTDWVARG